MTLGYLTYDNNTEMVTILISYLFRSLNDLRVCGSFIIPIKVLMNKIQGSGAIMLDSE